MEEFIKDNIHKNIEDVKEITEELNLLQNKEFSKEELNLTLNKLEKVLITVSETVSKI